MEEANNMPKNPKHVQIAKSVLYSRIKIIIAGALVVFSTIFYQVFKEVAIIIALLAAFVFF